MQRSPIDRLARPRELNRELDGDDAVEPGSLWIRVGLILAGGVAAAIVASLPAALRMGDEPSVPRALEQWLVLSAVATPITVGGVAVIQRARVGLRLIAGERWLLVVMGVLWWSVIELGLLSVFGAVLRKTTHHHALAGVTFAAFAVISGVVVGLLAQRSTALVARGGANLQRIGLAIAFVAALLVLVIVMARTSKAEGLHTAAGLVDTIALTIGSTLASSRAFGRLRRYASAGFSAVIVLLLTGLVTLRYEPKMRAALETIAPVHALVIDLFGR